jgi:DNA-binding MarR family transcriptional regulator
MFKPKTTDQEIFLFLYKISRLVRKHDTDAPHLTEEPSILQMQVLMNLSCGMATMSQIAKDLYIKLPTATSLVNRLIEAGYVTRTGDKKDRRITKIDLTEKGKQILKVAIKTKIKKMKFILDKLSPDEKKSLISIIKSLHDKLEIHC